MGQILTSVALLALLAFWAYQFAFLMMMEDRLFPGRFDKPIWGALFICVLPLAPFVFVLWKRTAVQPGVASEQRESASNSGSPGV